MSETILVTGGAGFLGSHLVDRLLDAGHRVLVVDNLITGRKNNLQHVESDRLTVLEADVARLEQVDGPVDAIYHMASAASPPDYQRWPFETLETGANGTLNMLRLARRNDARFLLTSTSEVYGDPQVSPQPESYWGHVNPVGPRAVYDEAKRYAEAATMAAAREWGLDTRIARIFNTYGPRMRPDDGRVISNFIVQALQGRPLTVYGDGHQTRSFCYVDDLVAGLLALMERGDRFPTNLGNPQEHSILHIAETIRAMVGASVPIRFHPLPEDDPRRRRPDIERAREQLGWQPETSLGDGLRRTIAYFGKELRIEGPQEVVT